MATIARQPLFANKIQNVLLITLSFIQTPIVFSFLISLFIEVQTAQLVSVTQSIALLAAGLTIGLSSIGSAIGLGNFAQSALRTIGYNRSVYKRLLTFVFVSQAIIETPLIFGLIIAVFIAFGALDALTPFKSLTYLSAALAIGLSTFGPSIQSGRTASAACLQIGETPQQIVEISRVSVLVQGLIDAPAIYALIISLFIIVFY
jgi:F-type H+-transporting ATPase subunit c